jgi:HPr kinase/phosphorylase
MSEEMYQAIPRKEKISVSYLIESLQNQVQLNIHSCGSEYTENKFVTESELHRPGLALAGFTSLFTWQRIQIIGNTEIH